MSCVTQWKTALSTKTIDLDSLKRYKASGIDAIELSVRWTDVGDIDWDSLGQNAKEAGIELWSYHLPFSREISIDCLDDERRESTLALHLSLMEKAIAIGIRRFVLHPSTEPNTDEERAKKMANARQSLKRLAEYADNHGAVLCVENLPRTCLGHTADEMLELVSADPRLRVCFDVNHLCLEFGCDHREFVEKLGHLIETTHMSDYDFIDERHFFPGYGQIDWQEVIELLENAGYCGPFLSEGGYNQSKLFPDVPFGTVEELHERHMHIKEFRGKNA